MKEEVLVEPEEFVVSKHESIKGHSVIAVVDQRLRAERPTVEAAKDAILRQAKDFGANAVINMHIDSRRESETHYNGYINNYTVSTATGVAAVVKQRTLTRDKELLEKSKLEVERDKMRILELNEQRLAESREQAEKPPGLIVTGVITNDIWSILKARLGRVNSLPGFSRVSDNASRPYISQNS